jgi:hypothetical protein
MLSKIGSLKENIAKFLWGARKQNSEGAYRSHHIRLKEQNSTIIRNFQERSAH